MFLNLLFCLLVCCGDLGFAVVLADLCLRFGFCNMFCNYGPLFYELPFQQKNKNKPQTPPMSWLVYIITQTHCPLSLQVTTSSGRLCQALKSVVVATKDAAQSYPSVQATQEMVDRVNELSQHAAGFSGLLQRLAEIS